MVMVIKCIGSGGCGTAVNSESFRNIEVSSSSNTRDVVDC